MAADLIENHEDHPAFQFFRDYDADCDRSEAAWPYRSSRKPNNKMNKFLALLLWLAPFHSSARNDGWTIVACDTAMSSRATIPISRPDHNVN